MTTLDYDIKKCFVCKAENEYTFIGSTNRFGVPDLDTRPPEMVRSTIKYQVERCPSCLYCAGDISKGDASIVRIVKSDEYRHQIEKRIYPEWSSSFICTAYIEQMQGQYDSAAWSAIHAAWGCDDYGESDDARKCRLRAIELIEQGEKYGKTVATEDGSCDLIKIDLLRRAGEFDRALAVVEKTLQTDVIAFIEKILRFQKQLIEKKDAACYDMDFEKIENQRKGW
ncbi:hypothetical protein QUF90_01490 [Desulfococcaceae bacterium HSG9]|nr:hypothetical protein [Desulfococcaceae bacterium HSG9]